MVLLVDGLAENALQEARVAQDERSRLRRIEEAERRSQVAARLSMVVVVVVVVGIGFAIYAYWDEITTAILNGLKWLWENIILPVIGLAALLLFLVGGCMAAFESLTS